MYDSEPDRVSAPTVRHGQGLGRDDRIVIILDPFHTGRGAYRFETTANGIRHDALYNSASSVESAWTVTWDSAAEYSDVRFGSIAASHEFSSPAAAFGQ